jgi:hypothetical protein
LPVRARWYAAVKKAGALLMKNEQQASAAFGDFIEIRNRFEPDADRSGTDQLAREIVDQRMAWRKSHPSAGAEPLIYWLPCRGRDIPPAISPGEWLLQSAVRLEKPEFITQGLLPGLKQAGATGEAELLEVALNLHFCPASEFPSVARAAIERKGLSGDECRMLDKVVEVMMDRKLDVDLNDGMFRAVRDAGVGSFDTFEPPLRRYCLHLQRRHGTNVLAAFYTKLSTFYLGPVKNRGNTIAGLLLTTKRGKDPVDEDPVLGWVKITGELSRTPELALSMLRIMEREFLSYSKKSGDTSTVSAFDGGILAQEEFYTKPLEEIMLAFRGTPALAAAAKFDLPMADRIIPALRKASAKMKPAFAAEPPAFGTAFLQAVISEAPADALLTLLGEQADELEKLPDVQQRRIATICKGLVQKQAGTSDAITKGGAWLQRHQ